MYYIVYVMEGAGIHDPLLTSSIQYIINVAMTVPAIIWMDRWGRRPTLLFGSFGMMTWLFISGAIQGAFGEPELDPTKAVTWVMVDKPMQARAVVACSYLFVATFAISWGPVSWTMPAEVFPNKVRAKAVSISTASNWAVCPPPPPSPPPCCVRACADRVVVELWPGVRCPPATQVD